MSTVWAIVTDSMHERTVEALMDEHVSIKLDNQHGNKRILTLTDDRFPDSWKNKQVDIWFLSDGCLQFTPKEG